ncbi:hypothetical protein T4B_15353 [Trichinella pseudospiralis]|uniref:Uncharacterized protein n=1 Tax=Trichinella pseudospiralis TaxID=6337 RepID=A0A0V1GN89_TRIPS|nr:hypothetical protein T4B_15353 [Trichinella pseudospiralis]
MLKITSLIVSYGMKHIPITFGKKVFCKILKTSEDTSDSDAEFHLKLPNSWGINGL